MTESHGFLVQCRIISLLIIPTNGGCSSLPISLYTDKNISKDSFRLANSLYLTDKVADREVFMKGIGQSHYYEETDDYKG